MNKQASGKNGLRIYAPTTERIARTMVGNGAYLVDKRDFFTWKSGIKAPVYTDCRVMFRHAGARTMIKKALASAILSEFGNPDYIVGVAEAGIVWSALVADELHTRAAFVRKQPKVHGVGGLLVGVEQKADRPLGINAVVVDDLVASGESLVHCVSALRDEAGIEVLGIASIVNWDFIAMRDRFRDLEIPVSCLVSYPQLLEAAMEDGCLSADDVDELRAFYQNPRAHSWSPAFMGSAVRASRS